MHYPVHGSHQTAYTDAASSQFALTGSNADWTRAVASNPMYASGYNAGYNVGYEQGLREAMARLKVQGAKAARSHASPPPPELSLIHI